METTPTTGLQAVYNDLSQRKKIPEEEEEEEEEKEVDAKIKKMALNKISKKKSIISQAKKIIEPSKFLNQIVSKKIAKKREKENKNACS